MDENVQSVSNQPVSENKYVLFFKRNKYIIFAFSMLLILLGIFLSLIFVSSNGTQNENTENTTVESPTKTPLPTIPARKIEPTRSASSQEQIVIENQTKPQLNNVMAGSFTISGVKTYESNWAIVQVASTDSDDAHVVVKKENGVWTIKFGPGTFIDKESLRGIGAPESLISQINIEF